MPFDPKIQGRILEDRSYMMSYRKTENVDPRGKSEQQIADIIGTRKDEIKRNGPIEIISAV